MGDAKVCGLSSASDERIYLFGWVYLFGLLCELSPKSKIQRRTRGSAEARGSVARMMFALTRQKRDNITRDSDTDQATFIRAQIRVHTNTYSLCMDFDNSASNNQFYMATMRTGLLLVSMTMQCRESMHTVESA